MIIICASTWSLVSDSVEVSSVPELVKFRYHGCQSVHFRAPCTSEVQDSHRLIYNNVKVVAAFLTAGFYIIMICDCSCWLAANYVTRWWHILQLKFYPRGIIMCKSRHLTWTFFWATRRRDGEANSRKVLFPRPRKTRPLSLHYKYKMVYTLFYYYTLHST